MRRTPALIVGGGPAGAAAAITLAAAGQRPVLIERTRGSHDLVCGGFLSADTLAVLAGLGIDALALGGRPIARLRVIAGDADVAVELPFAAAGLSRRTLDAALLARAAALGAGIERGCAVRSVEGRCATLADGGVIGAEALFLATGKHDLRGIVRRGPMGDDPPVGLRVSVAGPAVDGAIELFLFERGYAGMLRQEDGTVNLCLSVARSRLADGPDALLAALGREVPVLGDRLGEVTAYGAWSSVARIPYGWRAMQSAPGLYRVGDQAAVIASVAGDGVAIALTSGRAAADALLGGDVAFQQGFAQRSRRPLRIAGGLRWLAERPTLAALLLPLLGRHPGVLHAALRATRIGGY